MRLWNIVFGLAMVSLAWGQAPELKSAVPNVAVLDFRGDTQLTKEQLDMFSDRLQAELLATERFVVLDRSRMAEILKEQGFIQSGACEGGECEVEMGRMLGVEQLVGGKVVRFENSWVVSVTRTDVATGRIVQSLAYDHTGPLVDLLRRGVLRVARRMAGLPDPTISELNANALSAQDNKGGGVQNAMLHSGTDAASTLPPGAVPVPASASGSVEKRSRVMKWVLVGGSFALAGGAAIFGYLQEQEIADAAAAYQGLRGGSPAEYDDAWKAYDQAKSDKTPLRNGAYAAAGLFAAAGLTFTFAF